jgi:hypothetical protein
MITMSSGAIPQQSAALSRSGERPVSQAAIVREEPVDTREARLEFESFCASGYVLQRPPRVMAMMQSDRGSNTTPEPRAEKPAAHPTNETGAGMLQDAGGLTSDWPALAALVLLAARAGRAIRRTFQIA